MTEAEIIDGRALAQEVRAQVAQGVAELKQSHGIAGNPMRKQTGTIELALDNEWRERMPRRQRMAVTALTYPLFAWYRRRAARGAMAG